MDKRIVSGTMATLLILSMLTLTFNILSVEAEQEMVSACTHADSGGAPDGFEDINHNGLIDTGETDPLDATDDIVSFVCVLVHSSISNQISAEINRYVADLAAEGLDAHVVVWDRGDDCLAVKTLLRDECSQGAIGALLVGDIPAAWYGYDENNKFLTDYFYMDLNGTWEDSDNDGLYNPTGGHIAPEIWVGRLKASNMAIDEASLLKNYFDKNHAYRTGTLSLPYRALIYIDDEWVRGADDLVSAVGTVFGNQTLVTDPYTTNANDYLTRIQQGYYLVQVTVHGSSWNHGFLIPNQTIVDGVRPLDPVWASDIRSIDPNAFFYVLRSCSNAKYTEQDYIAGWYVFSETYGVAAIAQTKNSLGLIAESTFYENLREDNIGFSLKAGYNSVIESGWAPHYFGLTVIGDPTLRLMPARDIAVTNVSPSKTVVIQGDSLSINVTVENQGDTPETFNVTLYANSTATQIQNVTLIDRSNDTIIFVWDTTNFPRGNYTLSAYAWPVPRETETEDNLIVDGIVQITVLDNNPEVVRVNEISISIVFKGKFQGKTNSFSPTHCIIPFLGLFS